jgi:hypothetical protein
LNANHGFSVVLSFLHFRNHFPKTNLVILPTMNATKTRRLTREYLAAVDRVLSALDRAKKLRAALRRELARRNKGERRGTSATS